MTGRVCVCVCGSQTLRLLFDQFYDALKIDHIKGPLPPSWATEGSSLTSLYTFSQAELAPHLSVIENGKDNDDVWVDVRAPAPLLSLRSPTHSPCADFHSVICYDITPVLPGFLTPTATITQQFFKTF